MLLSSLVHRFSESETIKMAKLSKELKQQGMDVIDLGHGEPDFDTPGYIKKAAKKAIEENYSHYTPVAGYLDLREAICQKFQRDNKLSYKPENIIVSTGAKQSLANIILATIDKGDEVIIPSPYWVTYSELVKIAGGIPVTVKTKFEKNYKITAEQLQNAITSKTKMFLFSSPCNPTGSVYSIDELKALKNVFVKHQDIIIVSDEIYEYINFIGKHESIAQFDELKERTVVINGLSKGFAMTGWRLGYCAASFEIAKACEKIQGQITNGANSITQRAAIKALLVDPLAPKEMNREFQRRRNRVLELVNEIPHWQCTIPDGAFYILPKVNGYFGKSDGETKIENADDLCVYLLHKAHVATVSGRAFGEPDCIRLTFANSYENIEKAYGRIKEALLLIH